jgi:hypothetical protein
MHIYSNNINFCLHNSWAFRELLNKQRLEIQFSFQMWGGEGEGGPTNSLKEEDSLHFSSFSVSSGYSKESAEGRRFYSRKLLREAAELFHFD